MALDRYRQSCFGKFYALPANMVKFEWRLLLPCYQKQKDTSPGKDLTEGRGLRQRPLLSFRAYNDSSFPSILVHLLSVSGPVDSHHGTTFETFTDCRTLSTSWRHHNNCIPSSSTTLLATIQFGSYMLKERASTCGTGDSP